MESKKLPWIIPSYCDGCMGCISRCKRGILKMEETNVKGVFVPWLSEPEKCGGCAQCTKACAMGAICMTAYVGKALERFQNKPQLQI